MVLPLRGLASDARNGDRSSHSDHALGASRRRPRRQPLRGVASALRGVYATASEDAMIAWLRAWVLAWRARPVDWPTPCSVAWRKAKARYHEDRELD